jgi:hypothetical protein
MSTGSVHADRLSGSGTADATPAARFSGTGAVPFAISAHASADDTAVPRGAPAMVK